MIPDFPGLDLACDQVLGTQSHKVSSKGTEYEGFSEGKSHPYFETPRETPKLFDTTDTV